MRPWAAAPLVILLLLVAGCGSVHAPRAQSRPNVVVLMTDDQTLASLRVMSGVRSQLAAAGTTFDNAFVEDSLCCPSRSTFLTGQYAHNHTVMGNAMPQGGYEKLRVSSTFLWNPIVDQGALPFGVGADPGTVSLGGVDLPVNQFNTLLTVPPSAWLGANVSPGIN